MAYENNPITVGQLQLFIGFGVTLLTIAGLWFSNKTDMALMLQKQDINNQEINKRLDEHDKHLGDIDEHLASIDKTLNIARGQGILSKNIKLNTIFLASTPSSAETKIAGQSAKKTPQSQQISYTTMVVMQPPQPTQKPIPTTTPEPTPTKEPLIPALLHILQ